MFGSAWTCCSPPDPPRYSAPSARSGLHQGSLAKRFEPWHLLCAGWNNLSLADSEKIRESNWLPATNQFNSFPPRGDMSHKALGSAWPIGRRRRRSETCSVVTVAAPRADRLMMCQSFWSKVPLTLSFVSFFSLEERQVTMDGRWVTMATAELFFTPSTFTASVDCNPNESLKPTFSTLTPVSLWY